MTLIRKEEKKGKKIVIFFPRDAYFRFPAAAISAIRLLLLLLLLQLPLSLSILVFIRFSCTHCVRVCICRWGELVTVAKIPSNESLSSSSPPSTALLILSLQAQSIDRVTFLYLVLLQFLSYCFPLLVCLSPSLFLRILCYVTSSEWVRSGELLSTPWRTFVNVFCGPCVNQHHLNCSCCVLTFACLLSLVSSR